MLNEDTPVPPKTLFSEEFRDFIHQACSEVALVLTRTRARTIWHGKTPLGTNQRVALPPDDAKGPVPSTIGRAAPDAPLHPEGTRQPAALPALRP